MDVRLLTRIWHESSTPAECYMFSPPTDRAADRRDDFSRSSNESLSMILRHILAIFSVRPHKHPFSFCPSKWTVLKINSTSSSFFLDKLVVCHNFTPLVEQVWLCEGKNWLQFPFGATSEAEIARFILNISLCIINGIFWGIVFYLRVLHFSMISVVKIALENINIIY